MLNVDPRTLARWVEAGKLTALKIGTGRHRRYYADEVEALLGQEPGPGSST